MSVAVLNLNNLRDHESDAVVGKKTTVVRLGFQGGKVYHMILLAAGWSALGLFFMGPWNNGLGTAPCGMPCSRFFMRATQSMCGAVRIPQRWTPNSNAIALSTFLVALFMFMDQTLGA